MKLFLPIFVAFLVMLSIGHTAVVEDHHINVNGCLGDADLEIKGTTIYITHEEDNITLKITRSGDLYMNNQQIRTSKRGRKLLQEFNHQMRELIHSAGEIGLEAGKIGVEGAHIASSAISGLMEVLFTEQTIDDLDKELEKEAAKIEAKAKKLEKKAKKIEQKAEDLEDLQAELKQQIAELDELEWF